MGHQHPCGIYAWRDADKSTGREVKLEQACFEEEVRDFDMQSQTSAYRSKQYSTTSCPESQWGRFYQRSSAYCVNGRECSTAMRELLESPVSSRSAITQKNVAEILRETRYRGTARYILPKTRVRRTHDPGVLYCVDISAQRSRSERADTHLDTTNRTDSQLDVHTLAVSIRIV